MKNETKIKGDRNIVLHGNRDSKIKVQNENKYLPEKSKLAFWGIIIAILGLIATIIIGWNNFINFFQK